jgi:hypothetical protein
VERTRADLLVVRNRLTHHLCKLVQLALHLVGTHGRIVLSPYVRENPTQAILAVNVLAPAFAVAQQPHEIVAVLDKHLNGTAVHNPLTHLCELFDCNSHNDMKFES